MSNLYDTFRWKTQVDGRLLAVAMLLAPSYLKTVSSTFDGPLYMSVKLSLISAWILHVGQTQADVCYWAWHSPREATRAWSEGP